MTGTPTGTPTQLFAAERGRLVGLAYRILGTVSDAEDVVQEAWLRMQRVDPDTIDSLPAWLTTVTSRLALDRVRTLQRRREDYVGPWLPEPVTTQPGPEETAEMADSLTLGFLTVLDRLNPVERVVFLLADVFHEPFSTIATVVGRSEGACRQVASRARRRLRAESTASRPEPADRVLLEALVGAIASGDEHALVALLDPDAVLLSDGGPLRHAARRPVLGAGRVARFLSTVGRRVPADAEVGWGTVNGQESLIVRRQQHADLVLQADHRHGRVAAVRILTNPGKLGGIDHPVELR